MTSYHRSTKLEPLTLTEAFAGVRFIPLTRGRGAVVDARDAEEVARYKWCFVKGYAYRRASLHDGGGSILMHRSLMGNPSGLEVDHENGLGLDNRRRNLRTATHQQNACNRGVRKHSASGALGVHWDARVGKWAAHICAHGHRQYLGRFVNKADAVEARNKAAELLHGEFRRESRS